MSRTRTLAAVGIFLFGTTFLWLMPSFLDTGDNVDGVSWSVIEILVVLTMTGFLAAALGLYRDRQWWRMAAIGSAVVGLALLALWWYAVSSMTGVPNVASNLVIHGAGCALVLLALLVPGLNSRLDRGLRA